MTSSYVTRTGILHFALVALLLVVLLGPLALQAGEAPEGTPVQKRILEWPPAQERWRGTLTLGPTTTLQAAFATLPAAARQWSPSVAGIGTCTLTVTLTIREQ